MKTNINSKLDIQSRPLFAIFLFAMMILELPGIARAQVYVGQINNNSSFVEKFNNITTGTANNVSFISGLNNPYGLALSGNNLFVSSRDSNTVGKYDATTGAAINASFITGVNHPFALALFGNNLFVSSQLGGTVGEYDATTGAVINANFINNGQSAVALALFGNNLLVSYQGAVSEYNATTGSVINGIFINLVSDTSYGLALSSNTLFVSKTSGHTVSEYNAITGAVINANFITGLSIPTDIAIADNNLFVVDEGNLTLNEYNATTGATISVISGFNNLPHSLAVASNVPEPNTLAMLAAGTVSLLALRRRKRPL